MVSGRRACRLVFPSYGRCTEPFPIGVGVHEWQNDYWHLLDLVSARQRVLLIGGTVRVEGMR